jgi:hypothetical protein
MHNLEIAVTDGDGHATIPFLARSEMRVEYTVRAGERSSGVQTLQAVAAPVPITVR